ncbi:MAG: TrkA family potassium uptake protein [Streptococcaceae bacterium]|jgi:trk system potassium uptake protein TrkA|nr:TrkA family potassium uptake protein [Streptococcaceae bacterium]
MKKSFAVIGLGRFGGAIACELAASGQEVLAMDSSKDRINEFMNITSHAVVGNAQDETTLKQLGIRNFDVVVIAIGEDIQASILVTLMIKEMGVKYVLAKAQNDYHARVLEKLGADLVVHPESDMGIRAAHQLISNNLIEFLELSDKFSIGEIKLINSKLSDHTLAELDLTNQYKVNVTAIRRANGEVEFPTATTIVHEEDSVLVVGRTVDVEYFDEHTASK